MKLIHFADLHIGVDSYAKIEAQTGLDSRLRDFLTALDKLVDYALQNDIDGVIFAGDAYKSRDPSQTQQRELVSRIKKLSDNGIAVCLLVGNHDVPYSKGKATTVDIFSALSGDNIYVFNKSKCEVIKTKNGDFVLCGLPWMRRGALAEKEMNDLGLSSNITSSTSEQEKALNEIINNLATKAAEKAPLPAVLTAHLWADGASTGSERSYTMTNEAKVSVDTLANEAFCYVALGHIHKMQILRKEQPAVVYSGSLERLDFGEEKDDKGFMVLEIDEENRVKYEFVKLEGRRFVTLRIAIPQDEENPLPFILKAIEDEGSNLNEAIVRLVIGLNATQSSLLKDHAAIRDALKHVHNFVITREVSRVSSVRLQGVKAEEVTPKYALKEYLRQQTNLSDTARDKLEKLGLQIIEKEN